MHTCDLKFTKDNVISNIFYKLTDIKFETNGELPQQVCRNCFEKIIEIHAFSLQCRRTHSHLMKYLNNSRKMELNEERNTRNTNIVIDEDILEEQKIEFVGVTTNNEVITETEIKQEVKEETNVQNEEIYPKTSEFIDVQNILPDDLSKPNTSNLINEEITHLNDFHDLSNSSDIFSDIDSAENNVDTSNKKYKCDDCDKSFQYLRSFKKHKNLHSGGGPFICKYCSKMFNESTKLTIHMGTHGAKRLYLCPYCNWDFADFDEFTKHKRAHMGKCSLCLICGKKFKNAEHMEEHMAQHKKKQAKKKKCEQCDLVFQNLYNLQKHEKACHKNVEFQNEIS